jgi:enoyl-CoA hydratase
MAQYETCRLTVDGDTATVTLVSTSRLGGGTSDLHWELGELFSELRGDNAVRVVVLTGEESVFYAPPPKQWYNPDTMRYLVEPSGSWRTFAGLLRTHQAMAEIEKPIIAKVNGDAMGFGSSLVFACDFIAAVEDARFIDLHLAMGEIEESGPQFGLVPGDGGVLSSLFMSPVKAKEYLMLSEPFIARDLCNWGAINYAVPRPDLDETVSKLVGRLLKRPAHALAWTKRIVNRNVVDMLNRSLDAGAAYEMAALLQLERMKWQDARALAD